MTPLCQRLLEDIRVRNLSPKTQTIYGEMVARFAKCFGKSRSYSDRKRYAPIKYTR